MMKIPPLHPAYNPVVETHKNCTPATHQTEKKLKIFIRYKIGNQNLPPPWPPFVRTTITACCVVANSCQNIGKRYK